MHRELICIACPRGCRLTITAEPGGAGQLHIDGNQCPKGIDYGRQEMLEPRRMLTTTVRTTHPDFPRLPVRLSAEIPKDKLMRCMKILNSIEISSSCCPGDILLENIIEDGVNLLSTGGISYEE